MAIHITTTVDIDDLPQDCIDDCSAQGSVDAAVTHWRETLGFTVDRAAAMNSIAASGSHDLDEIEAMDDDQLADRILWDAACTFAEYRSCLADGEPEDDTSAGSPLLYLADYSGQYFDEAGVRVEDEEG